MIKIPSNMISSLQEANEKCKVRLPDGTAVPQLGQGTWYMGEKFLKLKEEASALRQGVELGMSLIDTAEMYADGGAERVVGTALDGMRDKVFLVSKVYPHNAGLKNIVTSCEESLKRMKTEYLDLYLLHWRGSIPLSETLEGMEKLVKSGKILRWGVSNFDTRDMQELLSLPNGKNCSVNQVLYHLGSRGIEYDLLEFQRQHHIPVMAYCPIAQAGSLRRGLFENQIVKDLAEKYDASPAQVLLAWCMRSNHVIAIPKAASLNHVLENAKSNTLSLSQEDLAQLDVAFPKPSKKLPLDIV